MDGLSLRKYADHRKAAGLSGGTLSAVQKAIRAGRIPTLPDGRIDPEAADQAWSANTLGVGGSAPEPPKPKTKTKSAKPSSQRRSRQPARSSTKVDGEGDTVADARARREHYLAELARLEYEQKRGELVPRVQQEHDGFQAGRLLRDLFLGLPARVSAVLSAETDQRTIEQLLVAEIRKVLENASDQGVTDDPGA